LGLELDRDFVSPADAPEPVIVGRFLWFCGDDCRVSYASAPGRVWRPAPQLSSRARLVVRCKACRVECSLPGLAAAQGLFEGLAERLTEHVGCSLTARITKT
jgi:hypothetical protein